MASIYSDRGIERNNYNCGKSFITAISDWFEISIRKIIITHATFKLSFASS
jgi:hypothetical protein